MRFLIVLTALAVFSRSCTGQTTTRQPIIDMHLHASEISGPSDGGCVPLDSFPAWDARLSPTYNFGSLGCTDHLKSPGTADEYMKATFAVLNEYNITGLTSGTLETVDRWKKANPDRILPASDFDPRHTSPAEVRKWIKSKRIVALAEIANQYYGIPANSPLMEPFFAIAEELDVPVGIHVGPGPPGAPYLGGMKGYRARLSSLLLLEDVLVRH